MKIKQLKIKNYIGIEELVWNPGIINIIEGPKGSGKTSITEAIEKTCTNKSRRTEVIRHGADEALLFIETEDGLEIDRRLRKEKSDYLKLKGHMISNSTEGELRKFLAGDIFRPLDFIDLSIKEQTDIILGMIKMDYPPEEINAWFGEDVLSNINTSKHMLQILKDIESKYYKEREDVNREIKSLEAQARGIEQRLPPNYDGKEWKDKRVQEYYDKVSKAQELNRQIELAQSVIDGLDQRIRIIKAEANEDKSRIEAKYRQEKQDIKDLIQLKEKNIEQSKKDIAHIDEVLKMDNENVDAWLEKEVQKLKARAVGMKEKNKIEADEEKKVKSGTIQHHKENIASKTSELNGLEEKKNLELQSVDKEVAHKIEVEEERVGQAGKLLEEKETVDITPLQEGADHVAHMQTYLREWDRMVEIRDGKLATKEAYSSHLTNLIKIARDKPGELLKTHKLPLEGIGVDEESRIRINGTLLDGLSDGEKLEVAFKLALQRMGDLRIMCLDGFHNLNPSEQEKIYQFCREHDIQTFVTLTTDSEDGKFTIRSDG